MIPAWLSLLDAILAAIALVVGVGGAHYLLLPPVFGFDAPMVGFQLFLLSFLLAGLAVLFGLLGIALTGGEARRAGRPKAIIGTILGAAIAIPVGVVIWQWASVPAPPINDITTSFNNPPEFVIPNGMSQRAMKYNRAFCAPRQLANYGKLAPLHLAAKPDDAFVLVSAAAHTMPEWHIVDVEPTTRTIQAFQRSEWLRFRDDFVIQVRPDPDGKGSLVEMRSRSRDGRSDFGVNYRRIEGFFTILKAEPVKGGGH